jgi:P22 coat protein - gene protein 5.
MANATVLRLGDANLAGTPDALFLKVFSGEVLSAFDEKNVTVDKHNVRTIKHGKSAQFPATWKVSAAYHTPGTEIVGQTSPLNERTINIDDLLVASVFIANIDEAKAHYETRGEYAKQTGNSLANSWDKTVLQVMVLAARASATVTGGFGGTALTSTTTLYRTSATDLAAGIYAAVQAMDEKDIPEGDEKSVFVRPAQYYLLAQSTALINRDWMGAGSYSDGKILRIAGAGIVKTNHLPITDLSGGSTTGQNNTYLADFSKTAAVVSTRDAVGTVKLLDLSTEMGYDMRRQGTLMLAKYAIGSGILRPECSVELKTTS